MDKYFDWEKMTITSIIGLMIMYLGFDKVEMECYARPEVASRIWFNISIRSSEGHLIAGVDGQRIDILKRRLIEYLDGKELRKDWLKENPIQKPQEDEII